jgi:hypothetical protein
MKHPTRDRVGAPDPLNQGRISWPIYEREEHLEITVAHVFRNDLLSEYPATTENQWSG